MCLEVSSIYFLFDLAILTLNRICTKLFLILILSLIKVSRYLEFPHSLSLSLSLSLQYPNIIRHLTVPILGFGVLDDALGCQVLDINTNMDDG